MSPRMQDSAASEAQLGTLIGRWRTKPSAELADEIDAVTTAALRAFAPPETPAPDLTGLDRQYQRTEARAANFEATWRATARAPGHLELAWLLSTLTSRMPEHDTSGTYQHPEQIYNSRLELLARHAPDPRISATLCRLLANPPFGGTENYAERVYEPTLSLIRACADVRAVDALTKVASAPKAKTAGVRVYLGRQLPRLIAKLPRTGKPRPAKRTAPSTAAVSEQRLLDAICANPDDDQARRVYADALLERGEPLGELINLQLHGDPSEAGEKQCRALIKAHRARWLGELDAFVINPLFRRGLLAAIELRPSWAGDAAGWKRVLASAALRTVEEIHQGKCNGKLYDALLAAPNVARLRAVDARLPSTLALLPRLAARLAHVDLPAARIGDAARHLRSLSALTSVGINVGAKLVDDWHEAIEFAALPPTLTGIVVRGDAHDPDLTPLDGLARLWRDRRELVWLASDASYTFGATRLVRVRTAGGDEVHVTVRATDTSEWETVVEEFLPAVAKLKGFARIAITVGRPLDAGARKRLGRAAVTVRSAGDVATELWLRRPRVA
jgi:uncharacterized protein (TIGR02996 family)